MSVSYWQKTKAPTPISTDVLIIGAGISGLSNAYWLSKKDPSLNITIVDKGELGCGASGRNAGFITCGSTDHFSNMASSYGEDKATEIWKFTEENHKLLVEEIGKRTLHVGCDYRQQGSWTLASTEHEAELIKTAVKKLSAKGVLVSWHEDYEIEQRFRHNDLYPPCIKGFHGGARYYDDGEIHPLKLLRKLKEKMPHIRILENAEVYNIDTHQDHLRVEAGSYNITTDFIVLSINAWSSQLFSYFKDKIFPTRGQILVTKPVNQFLEPCYCSFVLDYFRQLVDGSVLIGGFRNSDVEKETGYSDEINPIIHRNLEKFLNNHFPLLKDVPITHRWSGVMGFSKDGYPMVGSLPENPRIFFTGGFTGHGLGFAFNIGKVLADLMVDGKSPGIFGANRFN